MNILRNPEELAGQNINIGKIYGIYDQLQGWVMFQIMPNDYVARRWFRERCAGLPDSTVDDLQLIDLGELVDVEPLVDITPEVGKEK